MNTKKCTVVPVPEPPPPDPCTLQRIRLKEKAGIKICPKKPIEQPRPPPPCLAICIEKIKNPPVSPKSDTTVVCTVDREITTTARCDRILEATAAHPDPSWPSCPIPSLPPPPPPYDPCEEQRRREKAEECKRRMKRYLE
ncbi:actin-binding protein WASF1-like [Galleria mellonella]|uniref:Actin-binding protein WASF1-like n=1 Tax=Galleria mellonella TaxID=7137 RepID=A0A6J1X051_GALME|nr:actin-binding protein WASF1-like [Galleria mellonella]